MTKVSTTIRLDEGLKFQASDVAKKLWLNLSTVITLYLKNDFIANKWISFQLRDREWFTKERWDEIKNLCNEIDDGVEVSKTYSSVWSLINDLRKNEVQY